MDLDLLDLNQLDELDLTGVDELTLGGRIVWSKAFDVQGANGRIEAANVNRRIVTKSLNRRLEYVIEGDTL